MTSTQLPEHKVVAPGHVLVQAPPLQAWPTGHVAPQAPQFVGSVSVETQTPPQSTPPAEHAHLPAVQVVPPAQTTPHPPQFRSSLFVLMQAPPHAVSPARHIERHFPSEHT